MVDAQKVIKYNGSIVATPNKVVMYNQNFDLRIGKFYRSGNDDTYIGFKYTRRF